MSDSHSAAEQNSSKKPLGQYLIEAKLLTPAHIEVALYDQKERGYRLGDILAMRGWVQEEIIEWIVQNKLLPERQVKENDLETVLLSLKAVLERQEAEAKKGTSHTSENAAEEAAAIANSVSSHPNSPRGPVPPPPPASLRNNPLQHVSERDTLILPSDEDGSD